MSTFCLPDIRNTANYEILCGQLTTGETMNSFVQSPGGSWILSLQRFLTNSTFTCVKNSDCAAKRQFREKVRATQCLIQVCVIHWMKCLAPIGCFSLSVIHQPQWIMWFCLNLSLRLPSLHPWTPPWGLHLFLLLGSSIFILYAPSSPSSARVQNISAFPV